ncbi:predicted protein [Methanosarcina acetivorans C2A]|uniref:Uncharacterized protein n=1 Tax=Methanosarcina acetivorans (strain ATCC 35395 / DSM 2834 / JCM 12185 / C2A) TaxID=188937 RepID=Q8TKC5_METAC|nr:predicted protein [Methanosarcina acetivorans C2A]
MKRKTESDPRLSGGSIPESRKFFSFFFSSCVARDLSRAACQMKSYMQQAPQLREISYTEETPLWTERILCSYLGSRFSILVNISASASLSCGSAEKAENRFERGLRPKFQPI